MRRLHLVQEHVESVWRWTLVSFLVTVSITETVRWLRSRRLVKLLNEAQAKEREDVIVSIVSNDPACEGLVRALLDESLPNAKYVVSVEDAPREQANDGNVFSLLSQECTKAQAALTVNPGTLLGYSFVVFKLTDEKTKLTRAWVVASNGQVDCHSTSVGTPSKYYHDNDTLHAIKRAWEQLNDMTV